ncbi:MAG: mechanosensitive ion channel, partial [Gemmatimonadota bacterium]|nr:mechanosensitive ion channel [Gemmatimonadota bacterium]
MPQEDVSILADRAMEVASAWGLRVLGAVAVLLIGWMFARWTRRLTRRGMERAEVDSTLVPFASNLVYALVLIFVLVAVLGLFGIPTTSFVAVLGAASLAVGLALQGTLSNFASGVMLLLFRPFRVGDYIQTADIAGSVQAIGIFASTLDTPDNVRIIVPNSEVYGKAIR